MPYRVLVGHAFSVKTEELGLELGDLRFDFFLCVEALLKSAHREFFGFNRIPLEDGIYRTESVTGDASDDRRCRGSL